MELLYVILHVIAVALLIIVSGVRPSHTQLSRFELSRRAKVDNSEAKQALAREELLGDIYSLQRVVIAVLLVIISFLGVLAYHWSVGIIVSLIIALEASVVAHWSFLQRRSQRLYESIEPKLLRFVKKFPGALKLIRSVSPHVEDTELNSKEELEHLVEQAGSILTDNERTTIMGSLQFGSKLVRDIMTPRAVVDTIGMKETLGPLVLDDLHKTGHSRIPVIDKDIDHVVGILYTQDLLIIDGSKKSARTVEKAMNKRVFYINEEQNLEEALDAFIRTRHHLFIVVNNFRETVGILTLEDVMEALLGRSINDEFDKYDDLRAVAARNPKNNNKTKDGKDI
jgi:CBS domain containing-hemolysin-like protein